MPITPGPDRWRPDPSFDEPEFLGRTLTRRVLPVVTSPGRYVGGEMGLDRDGFSPSSANFLLTFPDAYEVGMRGDAFDGRLDLFVSFFHYAYQDYQLFTSQNAANAPPAISISHTSDQRQYIRLPHSRLRTSLSATPSFG